MQEALIALGRVLEAHDARSRARHAIKPLKNELEVAKEKAFHYGMFEDCGDFYVEQKALAEREVSNAVSAKIAAERRYKGMKLTFLETYPAFAGLLEKHIKKQAKENGKLAH